MAKAKKVKATKAKPPAKRTTKPVSAGKAKAKETSIGRAAALYEWVKKYGEKPNPQRTSEMLAATASKAIGFKVSANTMARELYRQNIDFRRTELDPDAPKFSKVELLRAQVQAQAELIGVQKGLIDTLTKRLDKVERVVTDKGVVKVPKVVPPVRDGNKVGAVKKPAQVTKPGVGNGKKGKNAQKAKADNAAAKVKAKPKPAVKKPAAPVSNEAGSAEPRVNLDHVEWASGTAVIETAMVDHNVKDPNPVEMYEPTISDPSPAPLGEVGENPEPIAPGE